MTRHLKGQVIKLPVGYTVVPFRQQGSGYLSIIIAGEGELKDHAGLSLFFYNETLMQGEVVNIEHLLSMDKEFKEALDFVDPNDIVDEMPLALFELE